MSLSNKWMWLQGANGYWPYDAKYFNSEHMELAERIIYAIYGWIVGWIDGWMDG